MATGGSFEGEDCHYRRSNGDNDTGHWLSIIPVVLMTVMLVMSSYLIFVRFLHRQDYWPDLSPHKSKLFMRPIIIQQCPLSSDNLLKLQMHKLEEEDFRNAELENHDKPLKGNNDLLSITRWTHWPLQKIISKIMLTSPEGSIGSSIKTYWRTLINKKFFSHIISSQYELI